MEVEELQHSHAHEHNFMEREMGLKDLAKRSIRRLKNNKRKTSMTLKTERVTSESIMVIKKRGGSLTKRMLDALIVKNLSILQKNARRVKAQRINPRIKLIWHKTAHLIQRQ